MQVIEHDQGRPALRRGEEELPDAGEDLALLLLIGHTDYRWGAGQAEKRPDQLRRLGVDPECRGLLFQVVHVDRVAPENSTHQIEEGTEGALRVAADPDVERPIARGELSHQSRLANAGLAREADDVGIALRHARPEDVEQGQLLSPPDEGCLLADPGDPRPFDAVGLNGLASPFDLEQPDVLRLVSLAHPSPDGRGHQDLARACRLLQARRDVDSITQHPGLPAVPGRTGDYQAAVDAHPNPQAGR